MKSFSFALALLLVSPLCSATLIDGVPDNTWSTRSTDNHPTAFITQDAEISSLVKSNTSDGMSHPWWFVHIQPVVARPFAIVQILVDNKVIMDCQKAPKDTCIGRVVEPGKGDPDSVIAMSIGLSEEQVQAMAAGKELELVELGVGAMDHKYILIRPLQGLAKAIEDVKAGHVAKHDIEPPVHKRDKSKETIV